MTERRRPVDKARRVALDVLTAVRTDDAYANLVLPQVLRKHGLQGRDAALATELTALGGDVEETADGLVIRPARLQAGDRPWRAYADHRMATAGALVGLVVPGVRIDDVACTDKTIPDFPGRWAVLVEG